MRMDDREFVSLDPPAAQAALRNVSDEAEQARLKQLYASSRGFLVDGTGWSPPGKQTARRGFGWPQGRMNRAQYWLCLAVVVALYAALLAIPSTRHPAISEVVLVLVCVPRLHDIGLTGWITAIPLAIELVTVITAIFLFPMQTALMAMGVVVILFAGLLAVLGALPGQKAGNRFGPAPRPGLRFGKTADQSEQAAAHFE